jgi:hypothetical protein
MTQRRGPDERFAGGSNQEAPQDREQIADAPTRTQATPGQRRTLGAFTRASLGALPTKSNPAANPTAETASPTRALQKLPSETARSLAAESTAHGAEQPVVISGARKPKLPLRTVVPRRAGPRSFIAQFMVAMIATAMVASALTLSTPVGEAASLSAGGSLQSLANSAPWIPTPTHTPKPQGFRPPAGQNPGQQAVINEIVAVFGSYAQGALGVAKCESGYDPNAWNSYPIAGSHASGVFQILYPSTWDTTSYSADSPFNADDNIHAAYQIFHRDGNSWREWQCQPSGHV